MKKTAKIKIGIACLSLAVAQVLQAGMNDKFYAGLGIGEVFDHHRLITQNVVTGFTVRSPDNSTSKALGHVFFGYGTTFAQGLYLGGELGTYFPKRSTTIANRPGVSLTSSTFTNKLRIRDYLALDLLPGYQVNEHWLLYLRAGATYGQLSIYQLATPGTPFFSSRENKWGGKVGVGTRVAIHEHFALGLDYFYTAYQKKDSAFRQFNINFNQALHHNYVGVSLLWMPA